MKLTRRFKKIFSASIAIGILLTGSTYAAIPSDFSPEQVKSIEKIVHSYLLSHPEVLIEASQALQAKMQKNLLDKSLSSISQQKTAIFNSPNDPILGNAKGDITLVEFFDYQCPHCKDMDKPLHQLMANNKNLKIILKEWPIFGGNSLLASKAALAAIKQHKYQALHEALINAPNPLSKEKIFTLAKSAGLNLVRLKKDMQDPKIMQQITSNFKLAQEIKLAGTPSFVLTNAQEKQIKFIPGQTTEQELQKLIAQLNEPMAQSK